MCEVCAVFGAGEHWSDFSRARNERYPFDDILHYRAERQRRIAILNRMLDGSSVAAKDYDGEAIEIFDRQGRTRIAATLNDVWPAVEKFADQRFDPLDPQFLRKIGA